MTDAESKTFTQQVHDYDQRMQMIREVFKPITMNCKCVINATGFADEPVVLITVLDLTVDSYVTHAVKKQLLQGWEVLFCEVADKLPAHLHSPETQKTLTEILKRSV